MHEHKPILLHPRRLVEVLKAKVSIDWHAVACGTTVHPILCNVIALRVMVTQLQFLCPHYHGGSWHAHFKLSCWQSLVATPLDHILLDGTRNERLPSDTPYSV